jgi:hypothetical protein
VNKSLGYLQIYTIKGLINKFTVNLITNENIADENLTNENIIDENITANNSHININYILKYEDNKKDKRNIFEKMNITHQEFIECNKGNKSDIIISFDNNSKNINKSNHSYYLRLYKDNDKKKDEDLNTLAITSSKIYYFNESIDNNNNQINFTLNDIDNNENYLGYLTLKSYYFYEEKYEIYNFTIDKKQNKENNKKKGISLLHIIIMIISSLIIIVIIIFSIFLMRMKKKNKELEEKVKNISFVIKDDDTDSLDDDIYPKVAYI